MSKKDERTKPKYETPTVIALGELARGAGVCTAGYADLDNCTAGYSNVTANCTAGTINVTHCEAGGTGGA